MAESAYPTGLSVADARERLVALGSKRLLPAVAISVDAALGRVLAADVVVPADVPAYANSAMDGFALRGADLPAGGERLFTLVGTRYAGDGSPAAVGAGECLRITTGAPLPVGADTVVIKENVRVDGDSVIVRGGESAGANVRPAGEDYVRGEVALTAGLRLAPPHLGVLSSFGLIHVEVRRQSRVALLTTGDELVAPGTPLQFGQIYDSNSRSLGGALRRYGVASLTVGHVRDDPQALRAALRAAAASADVVLTSGGVSAGEVDHMPAALAELGRIDFWKVRMRPGMPLLVGEIGAALVVGLPGNPVSGMATLLTLVFPALDAMAGIGTPRTRWYARLSAPIRKTHTRTEFQRARLESRPDGTLWAQPFPRQGSGVLRSLAEADALIVVPDTQQVLETGEVVEVLPLAGLSCAS